MIELNIDRKLDKQKAIDLVEKWRLDLDFLVEELNREKPWGAYWKIDVQCLSQFMKQFFPQQLEKVNDLKANLSPKFLLVAPGKRLSWQYHRRRAEVWNVLTGPVLVKVSMTDKEPVMVQVLENGMKIDIGREERHRLIGGESWGLVAEIWRHTEENNLSDENDVIRVQDDFGR